MGSGAVYLPTTMASMWGLAHGQWSCLFTHNHGLYVGFGSWAVELFIYPQPWPLCGV